jgi:hypothetical protein
MDTQSLANTALHRYYAKRPLHNLFHIDVGRKGSIVIHAIGWQLNTLHTNDIQ